MAKRTTRARASRSVPKTLTGVITAIVLAVLAALGVKTDWFHGKPSAPPTERPTAARPAPRAPARRPASVEPQDSTMSSNPLPGCTIGRTFSALSIQTSTSTGPAMASAWPTTSSIRSGVRRRRVRSLG